MKQRDLKALQKLASEGRIKFVSITQIGRYAVAEATNGFCYMRIAEKNGKRFNQGFFSFTGEGNHNEVELPIGYEIHALDGKIIGKYQYTEPFDIRTGNEGEFTASFNRIELLDFLKYYLADWKREKQDKYMLVFHRDSDCWRLRGYIGDKLKIKELPVNFSDSIQDTSFRFTVNPYVFRNILKWFECDTVVLKFNNGNYECNTSIFMRDDNKLAVLMPIARKK